MKTVRFIFYEHIISSITSEIVIYYCSLLFSSAKKTFPPQAEHPIIRPCLEV